MLIRRVRPAKPTARLDRTARLYRKGSGQPAELSYLGHVLMENRHGLAVQATVTPATGTAEREAALAMVPALSGRAQNAGRRSRVRHAGLRRRPARPRRNPARDPAHHRPVQCD